MTLEQLSQWADVIAAVVAVMALVVGGLFVKKKLTQVQRVGDGGIGIQSGRDTKANITRGGPSDDERSKPNRRK